MIRLSNVRIGTKLAAAPGIGLFMVFGIIATNIVSDQKVGAALETVNRQKSITMDALDTKASARGMQMAVKDLRLAANTDGAKAAKDYLEARHHSVKKYLDEMVRTVSNPANRERMEKLKGAVEKYTAVAQEIFAAKTQIFGIQGKATGGELAAADPARIAANGDVERLARERSIPAALEMEKLSEDIAKAARQGADEADAEAAQISLMANYIGIGLGILTAIVLIGTAVFAAFSIARPLRSLVRPIEELADGNFALSVPGTGRRDEVGQIAEAVRSMAEKVRATIGEVKASAREVTNAPAEISTSTTDLSQRTEEQAASLEETSASMEQMSATVKKNAENAQQANQSANATREVADRGGEVVSKAVGAMAKIEDSSRKISDIIGVIDEIARQTNLLALNAAVEAARAGDAGRGFAVVASEVRSLAQRSSQAAKDIKDLITTSNSQVKDGVELVNQAGSALNEIVESIKSVASIVNEIANASMEQSTGIDQINKALSQMDEVTQQNSALVEENAATAKTLEHQVKSMDEQVSFFQIDDAHAEAEEAAKPASSKPVAAAPKLVTKSAVVTPMPKREPIVSPQRAAVGPARRMQTQLATAIKDDPEWKEF